MAEITKQALKVDNNTSFPNNNNGAITPSILRAFNTNMIDSMVDEIGYNLDSGSWNQQIDALEQFTASASGLTTGSLLITASAVSNVITFTKGNGSTFNVTVADTTDLSSLNAFTASATISLNNLNLWTSSYQPIITNLQASQSIDATKFTTIGTQSGSWDNTNLNAYTASNDTKWNTLGALSGSFVTESETGSFARTNASNTFTQANTFTSISASSFISASEFVGNGSKITGITASISLPILDEGIPQGNAFSMNFTGSAISAIVIGGTAVVSVNVPDTGSFNSLTASFNAYTASTNSSITQLNANTASQQVSIDNLNLYTSSFNINTLVSTASFNSYTSSNNQRVSSLETNSASVNISISALNTFTASQSTASLVTSITELNSFTSSQLTINSAIGASTSSLNSATASLFTSASLALTTASFDNGTRNLTFTKGDNQTFSVNIPDVSGSGIPTGTISGSSQITALGFVSSSVTASSLVTASFAGNTLTFTKGDASTFGVVIPDNSGSAGDFVTTSSFNAYTSSNDQKVNSLVSATGSYATTGSNTFTGNQTISSSLFISGNINMVNGSDLVTHHVKAAGSNGLELQTSAGTIIVAMGQGGGTQAGFVGALSANSISASTINGLGDPLAFSTSVDSRLDSLEAATSSYVTSAITASSLVTASFSGNTLTFTKGDASTFGVVIPDVSGSTINTGSFVTTSSFNEYTSSNDSKVNSLIAATGSYATTGSNSFIGNQTITGSLILSSSAAIELQVIGNSVFTGSALGNVVSMSIASTTASMNLNTGNYFTLSIPTGTTRISPSNIQPGTSATLVITTASGSLVTFDSTVKQPSGSAYVPTSGSTDILSFVSVNSSSLFVVATKNMI